MAHVDANIVPFVQEAEAALETYWMPFASNRAFKSAPRVIKSASGHYYIAEDGRRMLDVFSGLWTSGLGHCHRSIVEAVRRVTSRSPSLSAWRA